MRVDWDACTQEQRDAAITRLFERCPLPERSAEQTQRIVDVVVSAYSNGPTTIREAA